MAITPSFGIITDASGIGRIQSITTSDTAAVANGRNNKGNIVHEHRYAGVRTVTINAMFLAEDTIPANGDVLTVSGCPIPANDGVYVADKVDLAETTTTYNIVNITAHQNYGVDVELTFADGTGSASGSP